MTCKSAPCMRNIGAICPMSIVGAIRRNECNTARGVTAAIRGEDITTDQHAVFPLSAFLCSLVFLSLHEEKKSMLGDTTR